ncbi:hypothetical protein [Streptomyces sp. CB03238]|uniref:hypothetical protein n=1 Tax=Streptomyces sp. CB03238 TaxID=1907777 RepID=UPI000A12055C|nr:hypothetical protein [Streptomyces sp. CB03238]ORT60634.1 hypothetical protein BKD26_05190 [Streptomyces sp. CB03238]
MPEMRFDRAIEDITPTPDGTRVVTSEPYRIWEADKDGRWRTPAVATLEDVKSLRLLPRKSPFMAVLPYGEDVKPHGPESTYLVDNDTDRIYRRLCHTNPLSVDETRWKVLLPHLAHRRSCD